MKNLHLLAVLIVLICSGEILAQKNKPIFDENSWTVSPDRIKSKPVVYGRKKDGLPDKIEIRGVIEEVSVALFSCGIVHWNGTIKIKLLDKVEGYQPEYAYVVATCFFTANRGILNKIIEVKLSKLKNGEMPNGAGITNTINSNGVAFYRLDKIQNLK